MWSELEKNKTIITLVGAAVCRSSPHSEMDMLEEKKARLKGWLQDLDNPSDMPSLGETGQEDLIITPDWGQQSGKKKKLDDGKALEVEETWVI